MGLYVLAFLLLACSWLRGSQGLNRSAFLRAAHRAGGSYFGLGSRMYLQGRPPVTNLLFVRNLHWLGNGDHRIDSGADLPDGIGAACGPRSLGLSR